MIPGQLEFYPRAKTINSLRILIVCQPGQCHLISVTLTKNGNTGNNRLLTEHLPLQRINESASKAIESATVWRPYNGLPLLSQTWRSASEAQGSFACAKSGLDPGLTRYYVSDVY